MLRRLYMLFPQREAVLQAVDELEDMGVKRSNMHTIANQYVDISGLPEATVRQQNDTAASLEHFLWNLNLVLFFSAIPILVAALFTSSWGTAAICAFVMIATFVAGHHFASHVPHAHFDECRAAIKHNEIALLVDVPRWDVNTVNKAVSAQHPDMQLGAVSWTLQGL